MIGAKLKELSKELGTTQMEIAQDVGISRSTVNRFFRDLNEVRASDFIAICLVLGIPICEIIDQRLMEVRLNAIRK